MVWIKAREAKSKNWQEVELNLFYRMGFLEFQNNPSTKNIWKIIDP